MNLYVGNLSYTTTEASLRKAFEAYGAVDSARIIIDKMTDKSKGFAFVEMPNSNEAKAAIEGLDGKDLDGRPLRVNEARPKTEGGGGGGGGRGGRGGGYGGGGGGRGRDW
ncbi:MAG: RNA-binding protein [Candidatus Hydrogenedentes bacterium]|nr:RNA-binding protein [Candidatus Hydrogenedentota bacterium]